MTSPHEIVVVPAQGLHLLGYYSPADPVFHVIQPFTNGDLAQATLDRMNSMRAMAMPEKER